MQITLFNNPDRQFIRPEELPALLEQGTELIWIDTYKDEPEAMALMRDVFHFHPVAIEDTRNFEQRPKLEEYNNYLFMIINPLVSAQEEVNFHELDIFIGQNYVFTVRDTRDNCIQTVRDRIKQQSFGRVWVSHLVYLLLDVVVDAYFPVIDNIEQRIENLEDDIMLNPQQSHLSRLFEMKRMLARLWHVVWPQRDIVSRLTQPHILGLGDNNAAQYYMRDVSDHLLWITDMIATLRETLSTMIDLYMSSVSNRLNRVVNRLTVLTMGFGILAVITGFYGMNFTQTFPSFENPYGVVFVVGIMFVVSLGVLVVLWSIERMAAH